MAKMANIYFSYKDILKDSSSFGYAEDLFTEVLSKANMPFPREFIKKVCEFVKDANKNKSRDYFYTEHNFAKVDNYLYIDSGHQYDHENVHFED